MSIAQLFSSSRAILQKLVRYCAATIHGQQIGITLTPEHISATLMQGRRSRKVIARIEEDLNFGALPGTKPFPLSGFDPDALRQILSRIPADWRMVPCHLVLSSAWIQWGTVPWLGAGMTPQERRVLSRKQLVALYGESSERLVATEPVRFGRSQMVAGLSRLWVNAVQRVFDEARLRLVSIEPLHTAAWNATIEGSIPQVQHDRQKPRDRLFATIEGDRLTLSWLRHSVGSSETLQRGRPQVVRGTRQIAPSASPMIGLLQRESLLQRLVNPVVTVLLSKPHSSENADWSAAFRQIKDAPVDWYLLEVDDWFEVFASKANHHLFASQPGGLWKTKINFIKADDVLRLPAWHRWLLGLAVVCVCAAVAIYVQWNTQLVQTQAALEQYTSANMATTHPPMPSAEQIAQRAQWIRVQNSLLRPWEGLFQCIESSVNNDITLMQIQPDAQTGMLRLTGDARAFKAIGKFVQALQDHVTLSGNVPEESLRGSPDGATDADNALACINIASPFLSSYQVNEQDPQHTVHFEINAKWSVVSKAVDTESKPTANIGESRAGGKPS